MKKRAPLLSLLVAISMLGPVALAEEAPRKPKLAVMVSIDGLSFQRLMEWRPYYRYGLKQLLEESTVEAQARYRHINSETGPGHASLGTGAPPRVSGIVANRWFESDGQGGYKAFYCTDNPSKDPEADETETIPGPQNLRVPTLGDRLVEASPESRVVSVSGKDRGAIFMAGRDRRHLVYWYDQTTGRFTSSDAYDERTPLAVTGRRLVKKYNDAKAGGMLPARMGLLWKRLPMEACCGKPSPFDPPLPAPQRGLERYQVSHVGVGFDHDFSRFETGYFKGLYHTPLIDELTTDLALAFLGDPELELGHRDAPDLLCISLSAQDTVSHYYGFESEENLDALRRLDVQLGRLLDELARSFPKGSVVLALSADHGFTPIPEARRRADKTATGGGRLVYSEGTLNGFLTRLNRLVAEDLCVDPARRLIWGAEGYNVTWNRPVFPLKSVEGPCGPAGRSVPIEEFESAFVKRAKSVFAEELSDVYLVSQRARWPKSDPMTEFVENDWDARRSGDAILIPRPFVLMHWDPGRGSGHGSPHESDIHVPLLFWGSGWPAMRSDRPTTPYDLAPTLGRHLGVALPDAVGKPLLPPAPAR